MIAQKAADFRLAGRDRIAPQRDVDLAVIVAEVAVGSDRAEIHPFADIRMAQEAFVVFVRVAVDDRFLDLAADPAIGADRHAAAEVGAKELGILADEARPFDPRERLDDRAGGDGDRAVQGVEYGVRIDSRRFMDRQAIRRADDAPSPRDDGC